MLHIIFLSGYILPCLHVRLRHLSFSLRPSSLAFTSANVPLSTEAYYPCPSSPQIHFVRGTGRGYDFYFKLVVVHKLG